VRLLVIGLDGATWTISGPLLKDAKLPHLAYLIENGMRCVSTAIEPAFGPIIWTSLASGKRPEKHGVTHFFDTANHVRCKRLWDILGRWDRPIGTWPGLSPGCHDRPTVLSFARSLREPTIRSRRDSALSRR
jgi:predicted AlkP superfamily phosphohydrolase/phosphomutase